jgi:hypothetical protein
MAAILQLLAAIFAQLPEILAIIQEITGGGAPTPTPAPATLTQRQHQRIAAVKSALLDAVNKLP